MCLIYCYSACVILDVKMIPREIDLNNCVMYCILTKAGSCSIDAVIH
ncbi:protein of unknown function [Cupriavidus taiwanensis]|nr:protein of unknown function [Cupriavidus taiwanensis]